MGYKKEEKICECCGKKFFGIKTRKYCSQDCSHNAHDGDEKAQRLIKKSINIYELQNQSK